MPKTKHAKKKPARAKPPERKVETPPWSPETVKRLQDAVTTSCRRIQLAMLGADWARLGLAAERFLRAVDNNNAAARAEAVRALRYYAEDCIRSMDTPKDTPPQVWTIPPAAPPKRQYDKRVTSRKHTKSRHGA